MPNSSAALRSGFSLLTALLIKTTCGALIGWQVEQIFCTLLRGNGRPAAAKRAVMALGVRLAAADLHSHIQQDLDVGLRPEPAMPKQVDLQFRVRAFKPCPPRLVTQPS